MNRQALDELKQQIPLMGYLQAHDWTPARPLSGGRWMGLCPLHEDHKPSFLVDTNKDLFYCYGCGRGGDVIRFAELYHQVKFPEALALLRQWRGVEPCCTKPNVSIAFSYTATARRLPICTNVESVPGRRSNTCGSATHLAVACEVG